MNRKNEQSMIPLKDLNLTNRFLFAEVMEDSQTQRDVLSIIFGREIPILRKAETEKEVRLSPMIRSVRLDMFSVDEEQNVYNTEMQDRWKKDLAKRSRYYQALMDTSLLQPGILDYSCLNNTFFIMIMTFDLFGYGKYQYTFQAKCEEVPDLYLKDGAVRIFLNTHGENEDEVSEELVDFLRYVENTTDDTVERMESERIKRIHKRVCEVRASEEIGVKYMQAWEERYYDKLEAQEEGRAEGRAEGQKAGKEQINELNRRLLEDNRIEDLKKAVLDMEYQQKLLEEYGLQN
ncbi:MAG: Rpn family recombination-promoting nuclease/putative transposase [Lachnospiraceae bacterium]|nr:Rpn family recombination-promoting nuclease/putative transposase [Lachnospiraceae bacterium]